jgi:hypothetical protein
MAVSLPAQQDPRDLLQQLRDRVRQSIDRLPKYMCTQTIDRVQYEPPNARRPPNCDDGAAPKNLRVSTSDRLRLDVGVTGAGEIYSWAGSQRFDDRSLFDLIHEGSISNGVFSSFLRAIFRGDEATFSYNGDHTEDGRTLSVFGFRVPVERSHYVFSGNGFRVTTAYEGEAYADPQSGDLVRLVVRTSSLSPETGACDATTTLNYGRVDLGGADFLLPSEALLEIHNISGTRSNNRTVFSNCHEFLGESTVSFNPPADAAASASSQVPAPAASALPAGLRFNIATTEDIQLSTAAAGDLVPARLTAAIRGYSKELVAPAGAPVMARLVKLRQFLGPSVSVSLGLKLESIEIGGVPVPLKARPNFTLRTIQTTRSGSLTPHIALGELNDLGDRDVVTFEFLSMQLKGAIGRGLESGWVIVDPEDQLHIPAGGRR